MKFLKLFKIYSAKIERNALIWNEGTLYENGPLDKIYVSNDSKCITKASGIINGHDFIIENLNSIGKTIYISQE